MTNTTQRYHIKRFGIIGVVIIMGLLTAFAFKSIGAWEFATGNSITYRACGPLPFGIILAIVFLGSSELFCLGISCLISLLVSFVFGDFEVSLLVIAGFLFVAFSIVALIGFVFIASLISFRTHFTLRIKSILSTLVFIELINFLELLAVPASFCYNSLRHGFFLCKKLCFEPLEGQPLCGSLYYIRTQTKCQIKNIYI